MQAKFFGSLLAIMFVSSSAWAGLTKVTCTVRTVGERIDDTQTIERTLIETDRPYFGLDSAYDQIITVNVRYGKLKRAPSVTSVCAGQPVNLLLVAAATES